MYALCGIIVAMVIVLRSKAAPFTFLSEPPTLFHSLYLSIIIIYVFLEDANRYDSF